MSTLHQLIMAHHEQARHICRRKHSAQRGTGRRVDTVKDLKRVGNRFTTRVEKRLADIERGAFAPAFVRGVHTRLAELEIPRG